MVPMSRISNKLKSYKNILMLRSDAVNERRRRNKDEAETRRRVRAQRRIRVRNAAAMRQKQAETRQRRSRAYKPAEVASKACARGDD